MPTQNLFELATRSKMRFTFKGQISVEDLWDLSPEQLDTIFKSLNSQVKQASEESLLQAKSAADRELEVKVEIVKHIFAVKSSEKQARLAELDARQQLRRIQEIKASKQDESLQSKSLEDLDAMEAELKAKLAK